MLFLLSDLRAKLNEVGQKHQPADAQFYLEKIDTMAGFMELEEQLQIQKEKQLMVSTSEYPILGQIYPVVHYSCFIYYTNCNLFFSRYLGWQRLGVKVLKTP